METAEILSTLRRPVTAPAAEPAGSVSATPPQTSERTGCADFDGLSWTYRNGFDRVLAGVPRSAWQQPERQGWQRIKHNARREVWRAVIDGTSFYLKYYRHDWLSSLRGLWQASACHAEWQGGMYALRAGLAAVRPAGFTTGLRRGKSTFSLLVTEAVEPVYPLNEFFAQVHADRDHRRRRHDIAQLAELIGETIARAHQAGFEHLDMHAANILVQPVAPGRYRTLFVDLQSARLGVPLGDRAVVRNLAQLNQWFRRHSNVTDRLRFLRAYVRWRNEYEVAFPLGRPLRLTFRELVRALAQAAHVHARRLWARRDRRACRDGRYFTRLRLRGGWRGVAVVQAKHRKDESRASQMVIDRAWWTTQLARPLRWFDEDVGESCKDSHSADVRRAVLVHPSGNLPVIIKRPRSRNARRWLSQHLTRSRSLRGWCRGHALLNRDVPAARPLAVLERRLGPLVLDSLLITEAVPGGVDLENHLRREHERCGPLEWFRHKQALGRLLCRHLRLLEQKGFTHRDCKASNFLVLSEPALKLLCIDMDGVRVLKRARPAPHHVCRSLARLHVSLLDNPGLTRTDRARFLRCYCARWGVGAHAWRTLWRQLAPHVLRTEVACAAHRRWKREHYGRE
ncbi:MAG: lipopolysaccharide kinase InaA family protein [Phycisphaerae bacterium]|jgi:tRNA A-37 threonylcarbamoyl transferase component Bud32